MNPINVTDDSEVPLHYQLFSCKTRPPGENKLTTVILLIHGWGMNSGIWTPIIGPLSEQYSVVTVDLPGYGKSPMGNNSCTLEEITQKFTPLFKAIPVDSWVICGWSMGGMVAQQLAFNYSDKIKRLILISSSPCFVNNKDWFNGVEHKIFQLFYQQLQYDPDATIKRFIAIQCLGAPDARTDVKQIVELIEKQGKNTAKALRCGLDILSNSDLRELLQQLPMPIDLIAGNRDRLIPMAGQKALLKNDNIKLHPISGASHTLFISHQKEFLFILFSILKTLPLKLT